MNIVRRNPQQQQGREPGGTGLARDWDPFRSMRDLLRWDPFREMRGWDPLREMAPIATSFVPSVDVKETEKEYIFKLDVPGMKEGDIDINVVGNRLTISGTREEERKDEGETYYALERECGSFVRSFTLPESAELENIRADMDNGVLTINVPKAAQAQPRRINVGQKSGQQQSTTGQQSMTGQSSTGVSGQQSTGVSGSTGTSGQTSGATTSRQEGGATSSRQATGGSQQTAHRAPSKE